MHVPQVLPGLALKPHPSPPNGPEQQKVRKFSTVQPNVLGAWQQPEPSAQVTPELFDVPQVSPLQVGVRPRTLSVPPPTSLGARTGAAIQRLAVATSCRSVQRNSTCFSWIDPLVDANTDHA